MVSSPRRDAQAAGDLEDCVIQVRNLRKTYGAFEALRGIDLGVRQGELLGLIGPDGAGKTTLFQILSGVMRPTSGEATVLGRWPRYARLDIGYVTQHFSLYQELTIDENLRYSGGVRNVPERVFAERRDRYLTMMELDRFTNRLAGHLSGGMKQKLALCCALISQPKILLLDEPTNGVDPVARREFWHLLALVAEEGVTTIVATPQLDEAEFCNRVALTHAGRIHITGSPSELRARLGLKRMELETDSLWQTEAVLAGAMGQGADWLADVHAFGDRLEVLVKDAAVAEPQVRALLSQANMPLKAVSVGEPTLEDVFAMDLRAQGLTESTPPEFPRLLPLRKAQRGSPDDQIAIKARNLKKSFRGFEAVKGTNVDLRYGEIYGLLGANGAGKTTTIQMLSGLIEPTSGEITIFNESKHLRSSAVRERMGYMSQKFTLYDDLTVVENLEFYCAAYGVSPGAQKEKIKWVLSVCNLLGMEKTIVRKLPRGWKQRIAFGASVIHEPEILFLDEPTAGVDPLARRQLWRIIRDFARAGTAILVTTHFMDEAEYCNTLGMMVAGSLIAQDSPTRIKERLSTTTVQVAVDQTRPALEALSKQLEAWRISMLPDSLRIQVDDEEADVARIRSLLKKTGVHVTAVKTVAPTLEEAFISIVQEAKGKPV